MKSDSGIKIATVYRQSIFQVEWLVHFEYSILILDYQLGSLEDSLLEMY